MGRGGRAQPSRQGGEVGLMRTRGLRWAGVLLAWAALTPAVGRTQTGNDEQTSSWWKQWASPPSVVQGQFDYPPGCAPSDPNPPSPLYSTRPEPGFFVHSPFLLYEQAVPLRNQILPTSGFLGSGAVALQTWWKQWTSASPGEGTRSGSDALL